MSALVDLVLDAAEPEMIRAGAHFALAAGADDVARAVLIGAKNPLVLVRLSRGRMTNPVLCHRRNANEFIAARARV